jgi:hypothetical protein
LVLFYEAAERVDAGDAGNIAQLWPDDPILNCAEIGGLFDFGS